MVPMIMMMKTVLPVTSLFWAGAGVKWGGDWW